MHKRGFVAFETGAGAGLGAVLALVAEGCQLLCDVRRRQGEADEEYRLRVFEAAGAAGAGAAVEATVAGGRLRVVVGTAEGLERARRELPPLEEEH